MYIQWYLKGWYLAPPESDSTVASRDVWRCSREEPNATLFKNIQQVSPVLNAKRMHIRMLSPKAFFIFQRIA